MVRCIQCGEEFIAKRSTAKYCSTKCRVQFKRAKDKAKRPQLTCPVCGKKFNDENGRQYCSEDCYEWAHELLRFRGHEDRYDPLNWIDDEDPFDSLG